MDKVKVTLDTNVIISAIGFAGKPRTILNLILKDEIRAVTSNILLAELEDVILKKFPKLTVELDLLNKKMKKKFQVARPKKHLEVTRDEDDNRVLEVAVEGKCQYLITGDKDLLDLESFQGIMITTPEEFLKLLGQNAS